MSQSETPRRRVAITGIGVVSPIGIGKEAFWRSLLERRSGIGPFQQFSSERLPIHIAGEVRDFDPKELIPQRKSLKVMCREIQLGVAAAHLAIQDAGVQPGDMDPERWGVDYGANLMLTVPDELGHSVAACLDEQGRFHFERWGERGMGEMFPLWLLKYLPNMPACHIGIAYDARGPNNTITQG
ncbi:MAG: beta-ketoacyl-[acyl-carrier-protein] synthase family protein, partial [Planctomycetes bacterium]|nr:beta-ketoacyl-[acyl-carrier-protein] synthase family protein [Planctomycetota bacterium]